MSDTITGYITCFKGRLTAESTIVIDGVEWPVPERVDGFGGAMAPHRIAATLRGAGYRAATADQRDSLGPVDDAGGYEIRLVRL